ncbi:hypothetical protein Tco_0403262 [Tanacetum coccineum]
MQGTELSKQDMDTKLVNEFDIFKSVYGESLESYYHQFSKIMNDLESHDLLPNKIVPNTKFLNRLEHEWKQCVAILRQTSNLHDVNYDQLYKNLKQNHEEENEVAYKECMEVMTRLHLRQTYVQRGQINVQGKTSGDSGYFGNTSRNAGKSSGNAGNECKSKSRVKDSKYFTQKMLLAKKNEAEITLNDEEHDFLAETHLDKGEDELTVACIMMEKIKEVDTHSNSKAGPSYDY